MHFQLVTEETCLLRDARAWAMVEAESGRGRMQWIWYAMRWQSFWES